jgi:uncharacterized membrane protein
MKTRLAKITRVAIFAALVFIFSYFSAFLYNVNPAFFIVFTAGYLWGLSSGAAVGLIGFFLWSSFNPMGPAPLPILISQMIGILPSAVIGSLMRRFLNLDKWNLASAISLIFAGLLTGLLYHIPVDIVDAFLYQPFWPRLIGGLVFSLITILSNCIIFPMLYPALAFLAQKEKRRI